MILSWTEDLTTGITEIDNEHKELFNIFYRLATESKEDKDRDKKRREISSIVLFLEEYSINHLGREERYMVNHNYPGYTTHKLQHNEFLRQISALKENYEKEGSTAYLTLSLLNNLIDWLRNNIH